MEPKTSKAFNPAYVVVVWIFVILLSLLNSLFAKPATIDLPSDTGSISLIN